MGDDTQISLTTPNRAWRRLYKKLNKQKVKKYFMVGIAALSLPGVFFVGQLSTLHKISASNFTSEHNIYAWGDNSHGQLGDGTTTQRTSPVKVTGLGNGATQVVSAISAVYALKANGTVYSWGDNAYGELGIGSSDTSTHSTPAQVNNLTDIIQISSNSSSNMAAALRVDGTVWTWGRDTGGSTGDGNNTSNTNATSPIEVVAPYGTSGYLTGVVSIAVGGNTVYATKSDGSIWAWGDNTQGQFGNGTYCSSGSCISAYPTQVSISNVRSLYTMAASASVIKTDGTVYVWGIDRNGELGTSSTSTCYSYGCILSPTQLSGLDHVISRSSGGLETPPGYYDVYNVGLFAKTDGSLWEANSNHTPHQAFTTTGSGSGIVNSDEGGDSFQYYLKSDGTVYGFGNNNLGQLGNGTTITPSTPTPSQVSTLTAATSVAAGGDAGYAIAAQ